MKKASATKPKVAQSLTLASRVSTEFANTGKQTTLQDFIQDYRVAVKTYVDYLWSNRVTYTKNNGDIDVLDIKNQQFKVPKFFSTTGIAFTTDLSGRALKCASTQACGLVKAKLKKISKVQYVYQKAQKTGKPITKLQSRYDRAIYQLKKPFCGNVYPELNSICCSFDQTRQTSFDGYLVLASLGKSYGKILIPIRLTSHWRSFGLHLGTPAASYLITEKHIHFRYVFDPIDKKTIGTTEGADQGAKTVMTLSDGQVTKMDRDGHTLGSIMKAMSQKKKGSKGFRRAQAHRTNYINWSINQLNLSDIKQINMELLKYVGRGQRRSRFLQAFVYKEIKTATEKRCFFAGVQLKEQSNAYRSQRCSHCGFVHKSSRRGKLFTCGACKFTCDADLNAALNHKYQLPEVARNINLPNKSSGFYWRPDGLFGIDGSELTVPVAYNIRNYKI